MAIIVICLFYGIPIFFIGLTLGGVGIVLVSSVLYKFSSYTFFEFINLFNNIYGELGTFSFSAFLLLIWVKFVEKDLFQNWGFLQSLKELCGHL